MNSSTPVTGYLLDTNIISYWYEKNPLIMQWFEGIAPHDIFKVSAITIGELNYGINCYPKMRDAVRIFMHEELPRQRRVDITANTAEIYGEIRCVLFEKFAPNKKRTKKQRAVELHDPATDVELGVDENDIWIAAQAVERNLTLVSADAHFLRIRDAYKGLDALILSLKKD
jgi:tRNA(fMet)-specific endonuclease VapC